MSDNQQYLSAVALSGRIVGALFYHAPHSQQAAPLMTMLSSPDWHQWWPLPHPALPSLARQLAENQDALLQPAWQRYFIGPAALPAPPWGSVWLDRESVLFGESLIQLRQWMAAHHIQPGLRPAEPEDHFGALLLLAAWLAETEQSQTLEELLAWHLFPWSEAYLQRFISGASHPFYQALGQLAVITLAAWRENLLMPVAQKKLYFC